jgi:ornithine carbamoyltransferase
LAANAYLLKDATVSRRPGATGPFALAAKSLAGNDLCSIADLSTSEIAALLKLAHAVKARPHDYRRALDAKQLVMFFAAHTSQL